MFKRRRFFGSVAVAWGGMLLVPRDAHATQMGGYGALGLYLLAIGVVAVLAIVTLIGMLVSLGRAKPSLGWIVCSLLTGTCTFAAGGFALWAVPAGLHFTRWALALLALGGGNLAAALRAIVKRTTATSS